MSINEALIPLLLTVGSFLLASQWIPADSDLARRGWSFIGTLIIARYLFWRVTETVPAPSLTLVSAYQVSYLVIETVFWFLVLRIRLGESRRKSRTAEADRFDGWWRRGSEPRLVDPLVDVFIPTYNESKEVLERTLVGVTRLDYSRYRIWILDDGARPWLAAYCAERGVRYLRRSDNRHYKAGNLNNALEHVDALSEPPDFIAVLDADFVVKPQFLRRTLALMHDRSVAVVQTPQHFFNPDPFQHAVKWRWAWPDEQRFFFDFKLPILDFSRAASCCGTSFLVRVESLRKIGGFPTESVSEDTLMSIKFRRLGLSTVYLHEPLSVGLNPDGLKEYLTQRARWALGQVQIAKSAWGPLGSKRTPLAYLNFAIESCSWAFFCGYGMVMAVISAIFWLTGVYALDADWTDIVYFTGPLWVEGFIRYWLTRGRNLPVASDAVELVTGFSVIPATYYALLSSGEKPFVVTAKGVKRDRVVIHWPILRWLLFGAALQIVGVGLAFLNPTGEARTNPLFPVACYYSAQTLLLFVMASLPCIELPKYRKDERYETDEAAVLEHSGQPLPVRVADISLGGAALRNAGSLALGDGCKLVLDGFGALSARVVRRRRDGALAVSSRADASSARGSDRANLLH
jgi:cellulose synthase (UDP-forming)